ncbi:MAG: MCP four helix bundle domain-containing protein, partial [Bacteroidales bacterium]|nr:MCP four helix bundle domain-containing protein [Bacteroidales bacterium]
MKNLRFSTRLLIGFSIIIFFSSIIVALAFIQIQKISTNVEEIYEHPFIVSNAVKAIEINVNAIHRSMKDVVLSENIEEINKYVELVNHYDSLVFQAFETVEERYLGNKNDVIDAHITFTDWNKIRSKVIELKIAGKKNDAIKITKEEGAVHVK